MAPGTGPRIVFKPLVRPDPEPQNLIPKERPAQTARPSTSLRLKMASPAAGPVDVPNGISTPPATANGAGANPSPGPQTQTSTQPSQSQQLPNGVGAANGAPPIPQHAATSLQDSGNTKRPRDARLIHMLLQHMGVHAYTERVPLQLMDFAYRYTTGVLSDAIAYEPPAQHASTSKKAGKEEETVSLNAVRTAIGARAAQQFSASLPKEFLQEIATERNRIALPRVEREFGVRLPPERYCFTGVGWGVKESWETEEDVEEVNGNGAGVGSGGPVGGAEGGSGLGGDTRMGGVEDEEIDEDEFEEVMGVDTEMTG